ncbi:hypothetical protein NMY22_g8899 [Coprinellus aureogranulatus]|nr:hypothetical protein NMY22_g8899 [Coprinellus aureogranulatus]
MGNTVKSPSPWQQQFETAQAAIPEGTSSGTSANSSQQPALEVDPDPAVLSSPSGYPTSDVQMDDGFHPAIDPASDDMALEPSEAAAPGPEQPRIPPIRIRIPQWVRDRLPEQVPTLDSPTSAAPAGPTGVQRVILHVRDRLTTAKSSIGLWREYLHRPTFNPDSFVPKSDLANSAAASTDLCRGTDEAEGQSEAPQLHQNFAWSSLLEWQATGSDLKSNGELNRLKDYLLNPLFKLSDLVGFNAEKAGRQSDKADAETKSPLLNHFQETSVPIEVPSGSSDIPSRTFNIPGLHYRPILALLRAAFAHPLAAQYHFSPYKLYHTSPHDGKDRRIHSEVYDSDAFIEEHDRVQRAKNPPDDPHCEREKVVAAIMLWSDSTHLANFGTAKLWPIYMFLGNLSKYVRALPNSGACQHVAYIPSLPDSFQDELSQWHSKFEVKSQRADLMTHCRRELMHGVWRILLSDEEFQHAYKYGIVIRCIDGVERRVFPRIFSYSADYPEKQVVLLATIRDKGTCGCPRCLIPKDKFQFMGRVRDLHLRVTQSRTFLWDRVDTARFFIYKRGHGIKSTRVEDLLKETSSVPTVNAFVENLGREFPLSRMMVPDFMHEFELGVWKLLFAHLIRLLYAVVPDGSKVLELDYRFRRVPNFGTSTIRNFANNTSEMKKLAARDFEDILQCCIPVFDGLFEDENGDNRKVLKLLYRAAEFHAFAKLRLHTSGVDAGVDGTLQHLQEVTSEFGKLIRKFKDDFSRYKTVELPSEANKRVRNSAARNSGPGIPDEARQQANANSTRRQKVLNISTYKFHSLADYPLFIRLFGGSDSISTQSGELEHRLAKRLYGRTNKRSVTGQIAKRVRRVERARLACERRLKQQKAGHVVHREKGRFKRRTAPIIQPASDPDKEDNDVEAEREFHTYVSCSQNEPINLFELVKSNAEDPAYLNFIPKLQGHLLGRRLKRRFDGDNHDDFTHADVNTVSIRGQRIYRVATCQVNYTTYDNRRDFDTVNSSTHPDVMVYAQDDNRQRERFWAGLTNELLPYPSKIARQLDQESKTEDWVNFYVNIFVDRDMVMRFYGGGVGHHDEIVQGGDDAVQGDVYEEDEEPEPEAGRAGSSISRGTVLAAESQVGEPLEGDVEEGVEQDNEEVSDTDEDVDAGWRSQGEDMDDDEETDEDDDGHYASD